MYELRHSRRGKKCEHRKQKLSQPDEEEGKGLQERAREDERKSTRNTKRGEARTDRNMAGDAEKGEVETRRESDEETDR